MQRRTLLALTPLLAFRAADSRAGTESATTEVTIDNFTFSPPRLTVAPGTRVTWTNRDDSPHTIVSRDDPRSMRSPPLDTGDKFAFTFDQPGAFRYFCSIHPHMQGAVIVQ